jgi:phosphoserine phosphatase RsbU/P
LNDVIFSAPRGSLYMTAFAVEIDPDARALTYCVAGHNPQYLLQPGPPVKLTPLLQRSVRLGDGEKNTFTTGRVPYQPGDRLVLYTDGVIELLNNEGAEYSDRRFRRLLQQNLALDAAGLRDVVVADLAKFADGAPPPDDVTLVVAELR